jgi:F-box-like
MDRSVLTGGNPSNPPSPVPYTNTPAPPIQRLPYDILSDIFILSIPDNLQEGWRYTTRSFQCSVMLPGSICRHWRDVAISTPRLWSSISLQLNRSTVDAHVNLTQMWLSRSGQHPLSLQLDGRWYGFDDPLAIHPVLDVVNRHAERWQHIDFEMSYAMWKHTRPAKYRLIRLHTLLVSDLYLQPQWTTPIDTFEVAPQLTSLTMGFNTSSYVLAAPWTQISTLVSQGPSLNEFYKALQGAPNLIECGVYIDRYGGGLDPSYTTIQHVHLQILKVDARHRNDSGPLFDRLSLPALRYFDYNQAFTPTCWPQRQFVSLISRSGCSLEKLVLHFQHGLRDDDLIECLRHMPSLVHLQLNLHSSSAMTNKTLAQLTPPNSILQSEHTSYLARKLEFIGLSLCNQFCGRYLVDMIESRQYFSDTMQDRDTQRAHVSPLKTLQLNLDSVCELSSSISRLCNCAREGLYVCGAQLDRDGEAS